MQTGLTERRLLGISDLQPSTIKYLLTVARQFKNNSTPKLLENKILAFLFFENSTRTRASFEIAAKRMGGEVTLFTSTGSSMKKGETLLDTAKTFAALGVDGFVVRSQETGASRFLYDHLRIPTLNAGDGSNEHPSQALLDLFTITEKLGSVEGKKICIVGDAAHSRVARSNALCLKKMGAEVIVSGPPHLTPKAYENWGVQVVPDLDSILPTLDAIMCMRVQFERHEHNLIPSVGEYRRFWALTRERAAKLKDSALILAPGPINRGLEIDDEVADSKQSVIFEQNTFGLFMRMALLSDMINPEGLADWLDGKVTHV